MELRVLGCHGGETPKHKTSSFLIEGRVALDAGAVTSMLALEQQRNIEVVLVSHAHLDHVRDLASLADNRCQQGGPPIVIAAPKATLNTLKKHFFNDQLWPDFTKIDTPLGPTIVYKELPLEKKTEVIKGITVQAVEVSHTIDTCAFIVQNGGGSIAYSGDTGPTKRLWEVLNKTDDLRALLMEVSFPDEQLSLAVASGHHTPETLERELHKLKKPADLPILLYHIKPVFQRRVEKELAEIRGRNFELLRLGQQFVL